MDELLSPDGLKVFETTNQIPIDFTAALMLEGFRHELGYPLKVNHAGLKLRGFRSFAENQSIKGSAHFSFHCMGKAFDISCDKMTCVELYQAALKYGWHGVGIYDTWVHVDNRISLDGKTVTWDSRTKK